jgi:hypothetical protein
MLANIGKGAVRFPPAYFVGTALPAHRRAAALRLLAVDINRMRALVKDETQQSGFEWGFTTFRRYPLLRTENGDLIVLSGKFLLERIAGGAAYWELDEHFKQQGKQAFYGFRIFHGQVVERHVRDGVEAMAAQLAGGARRIWDDDDQQAAWGKRSKKEKACDLLIDYGWAWVCIEVVSGRLTQKSVARGSGGDFDQDVDKLVEDKLEQLDATIRNLRDREAELTGRAPMPGKRFFPVVLAGYGFPANPITMSVIQQRTAAAGLLQGPTLAPSRSSTSTRSSRSRPWPSKAARRSPTFWQASRPLTSGWPPSTSTCTSSGSWNFAILAGSAQSCSRCSAESRSSMA